MNTRRVSIDQNEVDFLLSDDNTCNSNIESTNLNNLNFPWALINVIKIFKKIWQQRSKEFFQQQSKFNKHLLFPYYLQLLVVFLISIVFVPYGLESRYDGYYRYPLLFTFFLIQGLFGLFIVLIHTCSILFCWTPSKIANLSFEQRFIIQILMASANLITIFCIIWLFIGHVWVILTMKEYTTGNNNNHLRASILFSIIAFIVQYAVGIWCLYSWIQNNSQILHRTNEYIKSSNRKETTIHEKVANRKIDVLIHI
ncbi:hypothetical protein I4U23_031418 [Adineta vaga]|nr:hypothetical protein I4U23_031418 [Adineta vaga]